MDADVWQVITQLECVTRKFNSDIEEIFDAFENLNVPNEKQTPSNPRKTHSSMNARNRKDHTTCSISHIIDPDERACFIVYSNW